MARVHSGDCGRKERYPNEERSSGIAWGHRDPVRHGAIQATDSAALRPLKTESVRFPPVSWAAYRNTASPAFRCMIVVIVATVSAPLTPGRVSAATSPVPLVASPRKRMPLPLFAH